MIFCPVRELTSDSTCNSVSLEYPETQLLKITRFHWKPMKTNLTAAIAICLLLMASGCSKPTGEEYYPAPHDGARREYTIDYSALLVGVQKGRLAYRIDGTETINGKTYFKEIAVISGIPGVPAQTRYLRRDNLGMYAIDGDDKTKTEYLETPFPVQVGNSWTVKEPKGERHYRTEAIETLELFDRKYDRCLKVSCSSPEGEGYSYIAPGIGEVKGVFSGNGVTIEFTLDKR